MPHDNWRPTLRHIELNFDGPGDVDWDPDWDHREHDVTDAYTGDGGAYRSCYFPRWEAMQVMRELPLGRLGKPMARLTAFVMLSYAYQRQDHQGALGEVWASNEMLCYSSRMDPKSWKRWREVLEADGFLIRLKDRRWNSAIGRYRDSFRISLVWLDQLYGQIIDLKTERQQAVKEGRQEKARAERIRKARARSAFRNPISQPQARGEQVPHVGGTVGSTRGHDVPHAGRASAPTQGGRDPSEEGEYQPRDSQSRDQEQGYQKGSSDAGASPPRRVGLVLILPTTR